MGSYAIGGGQRPANATLVVVFIFLFTAVSAAPNYFYRQVTDECDWSGSGLDNTQQTQLGIQPVYLRCKEGTIEWQYPRGALRIVLRMGHSNKDFVGCLKVDGNSTGASIYLEGHQKLQNLHIGSDSNNVKNAHTCFKSRGGQVALFLEAQIPADGLKKNKISFMYDLQPVNQKPFLDCRPCSETEMLFLFCTSDFVARGTISSLYQNDLLQQTEITVRANQILRDSEPQVFTQGSQVDGGNIVHYGVLYRPLYCGTKVGSGEFLFMGRRRLGNPVISCAPRWSEWKKVRRKAILSDNLDCILD